MNTSLMFLDALPESPSKTLAEVINDTGMVYSTPDVYVTLLLRDPLSQYPGCTIQDFLDRVTKTVSRGGALNTKYAYYIWALLKMGAVMEFCSYPLVDIELAILEPDKLSELKHLITTTTKTKDILCKTPTPSYEILLTVNEALTSQTTKSSMR